MSGNAIPRSQLPLLAATGLLPLVIVPGLKDAYLLPKLLFAALATLAAGAFLLKDSLGQPRTRTFLTGIEPALVCFLAVAALSAAFSIDAWSTWTGPYGFYVFGFLSWLLCAVVFQLAAWQEPGKLFSSRLVRCLVGGAIPVAAYAIFQSRGFDPYLSAALSRVLGAEGRPISTIGGPVPLAAYLMIALPPAFLMMTRKRRTDSAFGTLAFILGLAALIITRTRGAWLGAFAGVVVSVSWSGLLNRRVSLGLLAAALLCAFGVFSLRGRRLAADRARLEIWRSAIAAFQDHPLLGVGPGSFGTAFRLYRGPRYDQALGGPGTSAEIQFDAHNDWLQVLSTLGFVGIAAYLWCHVALASRLFSAGAKLGADEAGIAGSLAAVLVQSKFNAPGWSVMFLGAILLGCLLRSSDRPAKISKRWLCAALTAAAAVMTATCAVLVAADFQAGAGLSLRAAGRPREAAERLESALAINPFETHYRFDLDNLLWDASAEIPDRGSRSAVLVRAAQVAFEGVRRRPGDAEAYRLLSLAEMRRFELAGDPRLGEAQAALDAALRLNPQFSILQDDHKHLEELLKKK